MSIFCPANLLIPDESLMSTWAVIACDQFTSQPEYWERVEAQVGDRPSALRLILPEALLGTPEEADRIRSIAGNMDRFRKGGVFRSFPDAMVYVERTLKNGAIRRGLVGAIDLEAYDFMPSSAAGIRSTERTVLERIPPRVGIRKDAPLELSHVLLLCDDESRTLIEALNDAKAGLPRLYDFDLMQGGGHIAGWLVSGEALRAFQSRLTAYTAAMDRKYAALGVPPVYFAVGDGNHSLAAAKTCWENLKKRDPALDGSDHPARYAMVELENIHDDAQRFEPIHRTVTACDPAAMLEALQPCCAGSAADGYPVRWISAGSEGVLFLKKTLGELPVAILQSFLDEYLKDHPGRIDYIHEDKTAAELARKTGSISFLLPAIGKDDFFRSIALDGAMPRKTFSMGHAEEKRYYLEARAIVKE